MEPIARITMKSHLPPSMTLKLLTRIIGLLALAAVPASAQSWTNTSATYPPEASQNWNIGTNWSGGSVPSGVTSPTMTVNNGFALINSAVPNVSGFTINGTGSGSRGLYIDNGGSLTFTGGDLIVGSTAGTGSLTVASGGSLTLAPNRHLYLGGAGNVSLTTAGELSISGFAQVDNQDTLNITGGNFTSTRTTNAAFLIGTTGSAGTNLGTVVQSGGNLTTASTGFLDLKPGGTFEISGGTTNIGSASSLALAFNSANATSSGGTLRVVGGGSQGINFGGLRYISTSDADKATWGFTLDNSATHITKVNLITNGNAGGNVRRGTLDVGLSGGVLLTGGSSFVLIEGPDILTGTNFLNAADYTTGTAKLWVQSITNSTRDTLNVALNSAADKGNLDFSAPIALSFASAAYGYIDLLNTNLSQPFTLGLDISGGTLSNFTAALTAAGVTWAAGSGSYEVYLTLNPSTSGGTNFAWDLQDIDGAMGISGIAVIPEPSTWMLLAGSLTIVMVFRRRRSA